MNHEEKYIYERMTVVETELKYIKKLLTGIIVLILTQFGINIVM